MCIICDFKALDLSKLEEKERDRLNAMMEIAYLSLGQQFDQIRKMTINEAVHEDDVVQNKELLVFVDIMLSQDGEAHQLRQAAYENHKISGVKLIPATPDKSKFN